MAPNVYFDLFLDSLSAGVFVMLQGDIYYPAMLAMGNYPIVNVSVIAILASIIGHTANWMMGSLVATAKKQTAAKRGQEELPGLYGVIMRYFTRYGVWLLLLSWVNIFGGLFSLFAGVFGVRSWPMLGVLTLSRILFAIYMVTLW
jgi:membrane protein YqaA with SNARE-associated domain